MTQAPFSPLIEQAIELAAQWHDQTYRKSRWRDAAFTLPDEEILRVPVITHVTAVALSVQRAGWDDGAVAAAFLHDVIEDANRLRQSLRLEQLQAWMGEDVAALVLEVTEQKVDENGKPRSWRARKEGYLAHLRTGSARSVAISLADKLHNLWTMNQSLELGIDVFTSDAGRKALSAGPDEQRWFHQAVLETSRLHADVRLEPLRAQLEMEVERFTALTGIAPL